MTLPDTTLLKQAAEWRLISLLFECPSDAWRSSVAALASEIGDSDLRAAAEAARTGASEGLYHHIFGPGGPVPPREVSYRDSIQLGYLMSEVSSYYEAFAFQPALPEAPDHISVEAGFVAYLRMKELYALAGGDREHAAVTADAASHFIEEHLVTMAEPVTASMRAAGPTYLTLAAEALLKRTGPPKRAPSPLTVLDDSADCGEL